MSHASIDMLGWVATATFVGSYLFSRPAWLRLAQMVGALLWITYGLLIAARPVIVANILVFAAAALTMMRASAVVRRPALPAE